MDSLQIQQMLLTIEPCLQPHDLFLLKFVFNVKLLPCAKWK